MYNDENNLENNFENSETKYNENDSYDNDNNLNNNADFSKSSDINFILPDYSSGTPNKIIRKKKKISRFFSYVAVALVAAIIGGLSGGYIATTQMNLNSNNVDRPISTAQEVKINLTDNVYFAVAVAEKAQKSVVGITTEAVQQYNTFFGPQTQRLKSMGSGFIVNSNGYIVTNSHVIGDGKYENIKVSLIDGSIEEATVLWYDQTLDLAVVKINKTNLPAVDLGDSDKLQVGEPVVAIGNPMTLDLERTVTGGIVSGLNRSIAFDNGTIIEPLIQTDASINSGNSGGPLFNAQGQVIGINTAKMSTAEGLGFSIPINIAKPIVDQVINSGSFSTVYVGITGVDVETYEQKLGVDVAADYGVVIVEVLSNSPASQAGLKANDIIRYIDKDKIENMSDLKRSLYKYKNDEKAEFNIMRDGKEQKITITLKTKPKDYR